MVNKLEVKLKFSSTEEHSVGALNLIDGNIFFKYDKKFIQKGINISPFKLKFNDAIQVCPKAPFENLFGVFSDSLPDGWGRLIVDRYLISTHKSPDRYTPLDRLSLIGQNGAGALTYQPEQTHDYDNDIAIGLTEYAERSIQILSGQNEEISEDFYRLTGTSGGARPKIQVIYNSLEDSIKPMTNLVGEQESFWIIKFPSTHDLPDIAKIEYAYYLMAKDAGIDVSDSKLFAGNKGNVFFGTKRFDCIGNEKLHLHSAAGLLHDDFRKSTLDYGHIIDASIRMEQSKDSVEKVMRLAMFNVLTANQDDHSKNFSFLMDKSGKWVFSPAYDLTFSPNVYGFQTTSVAGKNKTITKQDFERLGGHFGISNTSKLWSETVEVVSEWKHYAKTTDLTSSSTKRIWEHIKPYLKK